MPQTRFVLRKALELDLRAIVVVDKIRPQGRAAAGGRTIKPSTLFVELGASDEQADFRYSSPTRRPASRSALARR